MIQNRSTILAIASLAVASLFGGCAGNGGAPPQLSAHTADARHILFHHGIGLGKILSTHDGGQIFGFDINQNGNDGILTSSLETAKPGVMKVAVVTFDQNTGRLTSTFARATGKKNSYSVDGIAAGDVALVTHYVEPKHSIFARRKYATIDPITAHAFTGTWTPPIRDIDVQQLAENQTTSTSVALAIELKDQDRPDLIVSNVAANTFSKVIHLDPALFSLADGPQLAQYMSADQAVIALSPDAGAVGGSAPLNVVFDLKSGKSEQFDGYNNGFFHAGYVNGLAVDPNTGVAVTDTELNAQVEFYDVKKRQGIAAVQLPCTGPSDQSNSGAGITVDAVNKLFLVTDPFYCNGSQGSALVVYDETGHLLETITGFKFAIAEPPVAINPRTGTGWAFGPAFSQLQQFFY